MEMAGKVSKFASKVSKVKRTGLVSFPTDDGEVIEFQVESRSSDQIDAVNEKYDALKPKVPTKKVPSGKGFKIIENEKDVEYLKALGAVQKRQFAEMAILLLSEDERPEGDIEEQIDEVLKVELAGFIGKIVNRGLELSGLGDDQEDLDEVKND